MYLKLWHYLCKMWGPLKQKRLFVESRTGLRPRCGETFSPCWDAVGGVFSVYVQIDLWREKRKNVPIVQRTNSMYEIQFCIYQVLLLIDSANADENYKLTNVTRELHSPRW